MHSVVIVFAVFVIHILINERRSVVEGSCVEINWLGISPGLLNILKAILLILLSILERNSVCLYITLPLLNRCSDITEICNGNTYFGSWGRTKASLFPNNQHTCGRSLRQKLVINKNASKQNLEPWSLSTVYNISILLEAKSICLGRLLVAFKQSYNFFICCVRCM